MDSFLAEGRKCCQFSRCIRNNFCCIASVQVAHTRMGHRWWVLVFQVQGTSYQRPCSTAAMYVPAIIRTHRATHQAPSVNVDRRGWMTLSKRLAAIVAALRCVEVCEMLKLYHSIMTGCLAWHGLCTQMMDGVSDCEYPNLRSVHVP